MSKHVSVDKVLFSVTLALLVMGLGMVYSASAVMAQQKFHASYYFLVRQIVFVVIGLAAMYVTMRVDYRQYRRPTLIVFSLGVTALLIVLAYAMGSSHNTHRWIKLGFFSLQPSELAKPAIILFLAWYLDKNQKTLNEPRTLAKAVGVPALLILAIVKQPDLGTAMTCTAIMGVILFMAGVRLKYFAYALPVVVAGIGYEILHASWRMKRMFAFIDPSADPQGSGFHILQSLIAVGTGGVWGVGIMESKQKLFYLPEAHTDFIFAVLCEEWGLIGAAAVVICFVILCWRGLRAANKTRDNFGKLIAYGVTSMVGIQAFFNISVVLSLLPTKGLPLPLISYGGTSAAVMLVCIGVLLQISQEAS